MDVADGPVIRNGRMTVRTVFFIELLKSERKNHRGIRKVLKHGSRQTGLI